MDFYEQPTTNMVSFLPEMSILTVTNVKNQRIKRDVLKYTYTCCN